MYDAVSGIGEAHPLGGFLGIPGTPYSIQPHFFLAPAFADGE